MYNNRNYSYWHERVLILYKFSSPSFSPHTNKHMKYIFDIPVALFEKWKMWSNIQSDEQIVVMF